MISNYVNRNVHYLEERVFNTSDQMWQYWFQIIVPYITAYKTIFGSAFIPIKNNEVFQSLIIKHNLLKNKF